jgi:streptogramin lyase
LPQPTSAPAPGHVPGALGAAKNVERVDLGATAARAIASSGARIWFVDDGGMLFAVDSDTGVVTKFAATGLVSTSTLMTASATSVYLADPASARIAVVDVSSGIARTADAPFGDSITGMAIGPSGHLWLVASRYAGLIDFDPASKGFALIAASNDARPSAVAVDLAGRVWFADSARHTVGFYESTFGRITERPAPTRSAVTSAVADRTGQVWFSTADGYVFTAAATEAGVTRRVAGSVAQLASGGGSVWFVSGDSPALVGSPTEDLRVTLSSGARSLAVDSRGRAWVADPSAHALFVVDRD